MMYTFDDLTDKVDEFTGKDLVDKAISKHQHLKENYHNKHSLYSQCVDIYGREVGELIEKINDKKQYITEILFAKMKNILSKTKYDEQINLEHINNKRETIKANEVRSKEELFSIDFDKALTWIEAFFTLGVRTSKKARETLDRVEEEEKRIQEVFERMDANVKRMKILQSTLQQLLDYLTDMVNVYEIILHKANNVTKLLRYRTMQFTHKTSQTHYKLSILPKADQELLFALFHFSVLLYRIVKRNWLGNSDEEVLENNKALISLNKKYQIVKAKYAA